MTTISSSDVLFVGRGNSVVSWYRTGMPSLHLGSDWIGIVGKPPNLGMVGSLKRGGSGRIPDFTDYKVIVLQQVSGKEWMNEIFRLKALGIRVLYEVDDYLHAVRKVRGHGSAKGFSKKILSGYELCMKACDGMIVSTDYLKRRYAKYNKNIWVCMNSVETGRYKDLTLPKRDTVNIGWAGGEGHQVSSRLWLGAVSTVLECYDWTRFISIGLPLAGKTTVEGRGLAIPFVAIEQFPPALCNFDIAIAPAETNNFFAAKSDLRFLECGALGIPCVAHPFVYGDTIVDGVTGFLADDPDKAGEDMAFLVCDPDRRGEMGQNAKEYVETKRSIQQGVSQWEHVFVSTGG